MSNDHDRNRREAPVITVPTITLDGDANGVPPMSGLSALPAGPLSPTHVVSKTAPAV